MSLQGEVIAVLDISLMGKRIKECRLRKGLTSDQLAEAVNVSSVFIKDIERGVKCPRMDNFIKIANALEATADELLCDSVNADTVLLLNEVTQRMQNLNPNQITSIANVIDSLIDEFCSNK